MRFERAVRTVGTLSLVVSLAMASGCGSDDGDDDNNATGGCNASNATATTSVSVQDNRFSPTCFKVSSGATVTFTNAGASPHTVTSDGGQVDTFDSGTLQSAATFQHTFSVAGTIKMHCKFHSGMNATVVVQ